jgi:hypothetical protein
MHSIDDFVLRSLEFLIFLDTHCEATHVENVNKKHGRGSPDSSAPKEW